MSVIIGMSIVTKNRPWFNPANHLCQDCLQDAHIPSGNEREAVIQLHGRWLCEVHHHRRVNATEAIKELFEVQ